MGDNTKDVNSSDPTARAGRRTRWLLALAILLGVLGLSAAAVDWATVTGTRGTDVRGTVAVWGFFGLRLLGVLVVAAAFLAYVRAWARQHSNSVPRSHHVGPERYPLLTELTADEYVARVREKTVMFSQMGVDDAAQLRHLLLQPDQGRVRVNEDIDLRLQQYIREVQVTWREGALPHVGKGIALPIIRGSHSVSPRELNVRNGRFLTALESAALMAQMASRLGLTSDQMVESLDGFQSTLPLGLPEPPRADPASEDGGLVAWFRAKAPGQRVGHSQNAPGRVHDDELIRATRDRRVHFAYYETAAQMDHVMTSRTTEFTFRSPPDAPEPAPEYHPWRQRKDNLRRFLRLPTRFVYIRLEKALSARTYRLRVRCDEDLYIEEANVWALPGRHWLSRQDPHSMYRAHLTWEKPTGKAFIELSTSRLSDEEPERSGTQDSSAPFEDLYLALRLTEKPPGVLGAATALAFSALTVLWIGGIFGAVPANGIDPISFTLALPALAASVMGFTAFGPRHGRRSATGLLSVAASLVLCVGAIFLRVGQTRGLADSWDLPAKFMGMSDGLWVVMTGLAFIVFAITLGTLLMRSQRFAFLAGLRDEPRTPADDG